MALRRPLEYRRCSSNRRGRSRARDRWRYGDPGNTGGVPATKRVGWRHGHRAHRARQRPLPGHPRRVHHARGRRHRPGPRRGRRHHLLPGVLRPRLSRARPAGAATRRRVPRPRLDDHRRRSGAGTRHGRARHRTHRRRSRCASPRWSSTGTARSWAFRTRCSSTRRRTRSTRRARAAASSRPGPLTFGVAICHEGWRYPETVRWAARRGAHVVFHPHFHQAEPGGYRPTTFADPGQHVPREGGPLPRRREHLLFRHRQLRHRGPRHDLRGRATRRDRAGVASL